MESAQRDKSSRVNDLHNAKVLHGALKSWS